MKFGTMILVLFFNVILSGKWELKFPKQPMKNLLIAVISLWFCTAMNAHAIGYEYVDGSGNVYRLSPLFIEYEPVQAELSSSGIYSGGEAVKKSISANDYETISQLLQTAINNKAIHIQNRLMGSGMILIRQQTDTTTILLSQNAKEKINLETLLKALINATHSGGK